MGTPMRLPIDVVDLPATPEDADLWLAEIVRALVFLIHPGPNALLFLQRCEVGPCAVLRDISGSGAVRAAMAPP